MGSIYKAYDIRGIAETELSDELAVRIARAVVEYTGARVVAVGRDARVSSPRLSAAVVRGLLASGVRVIDIGLCTTPMFNFTVASDAEVEAGIMVTASHNPAQYNGFKMVGKGAEPIAGTVIENTVNGMRGEKRGAGMEGNTGKGVEDANMGGQVELRDARGAYLDAIFALSGVTRADTASVGKVVIDAGNGMVGVLLHDFLVRAGIDAKVLFGEVNGSFPNHEPNPAHEENLADLKKAVVATGAAFGVAFDGDADRIGFVDERGTRIAGDHVGVLLVEELLQRPLGGKGHGGVVIADRVHGARPVILGDTNAGRAYEEAVIAQGATFARVPVGHANIKREMRERKALFAAELSYHFYYADFFFVESTLLTLLLVLKRYARAQRRMSDLVAPLRVYSASGEVNVVLSEGVLVADIFAKLEMLSAAGTFGNVKRVLKEDGVRIEFADAWFCVRASNTEPLVRLNVEANTRERMEELRDALMRIVGDLD